MGAVHLAERTEKGVDSSRNTLRDVLGGKPGLAEIAASCARLAQG